MEAAPGTQTCCIYLIFYFIHVIDLDCSAYMYFMNLIKLSKTDSNPKILVHMCMYVYIYYYHLPKLIFCKCCAMLSLIKTPSMHTSSVLTDPYFFLHPLFFVCREMFLGHARSTYYHFHSTYKRSRDKHV